MFPLHWRYFRHFKLLIKSEGDFFSQQCKRKLEKRWPWFVQYFKTLKQVSSKTYILAEWADINSHTMPTFSIILLNNLLILREHQRPFNVLYYYPWKVFGVLSFLLYKKGRLKKFFLFFHCLKLFYGHGLEA